jgi:hypothetical protein
VTDDLNRKLNAIVGAALKAMADSGAPDEVLGAFAADHRDKVAGILGLAPQRVEAPDLVAVVEQAVQRVLDRHESTTKTATGPKKVRKYVLVDGKRTSVTIYGDTFNGLLAREGGEQRSAMKIVNQLANTMPVGGANRSNWVEQRLQALLHTDIEQSSASAARH